MKSWKRIAVKVGTSTLCYSSGRLNIRRVEKLVKVLCDLKNAGNEILLISSGAIAMGVGKMNLESRPSDMSGKQAVAAVGQCELMYVYDKLFSEYNHTVAQILLTGDDLENENRKINFQNTMFRLLEYGVIPILNENDTMSTTEITSIGDNDTLASLVSVDTKCDLLILLSDIDGLYTADPRSDAPHELISRVDAIDEDIKKIAGGAGSKHGTGGMITKIHAAEICTDKGIDMIICNGEDPDILYDIADHKKVGTLFKGKKS